LLGHPIPAPLIGVHPVSQQVGSPVSLGICWNPYLTPARMSDPLAVIAQCLAEIEGRLFLGPCEPQRAVGEHSCCGEYQYERGGKQPRPTAKPEHVRLSKFTRSFQQITSAVKRALRGSANRLRAKSSPIIKCGGCGLLLGVICCWPIT